ncbi:glycine--tRNA ligase subunit beta [Thioflexithrix psekupsensis]|uniref:Glycine--tRNA ligase beta subunit n=1 Tax=Thioflexithrix psekupsensis TaxID=1570016 RepID=A0A251X490_9GAMM|nr:glycine--tRNA ligase subunit beta [Thioflexithrix psekupsensis]OUD12175.1 glycine--tRNA ligase subunit beta [Thioflexithrix psekupsensis]
MSHPVTHDLLIEIGTEELPPKALERLSEAFASAICEALTQQQLSYTIATPYATPRRLAVLIHGVPEQSPSQVIEKRGPALQAAYNAQGQPTPAAVGFARSCGVEVSDLARLETDKGSWLVYRATREGAPTRDLIPDFVQQALAALPIPKRMRWADFDYEFVRPVRWIVLLFGTEVIHAEIMGVRSDRITHGHRFHAPQPIVLNSPKEYASRLETEGYVIPLFSVRQKNIENLVKQTAETAGGFPIIDPDLLKEVASLVEWPVPVLGHFDPQFLQVPAEALIATMKGNQKCFHLVDEHGKLLPYFIAISNLASKNPEAVRLGNERVIRPRLSDAAFFWTQDKATSLNTRRESLKQVVFQNKLGTLYEKSQRVGQLTAVIAQSLGADGALGQRAGELGKCDLITAMVGEFPELQGIMGEYYARHDGEAEAVAVALREQYLPRFWGDQLPETALGQALSLAEKIDTLCGIFGIGQPPTGDKDPFALRRAALGILRILIEKALPLDMMDLLKAAISHYPNELLLEETAHQAFDFISERLRGYCVDRGIHQDSVEAVICNQPTQPFDAYQRMLAVDQFRALPEAVSLAAANKRIFNLLKKTDNAVFTAINPALFQEKAEQALYDQWQQSQPKVVALINAGDYPAALQHLAILKEPVDAFFEQVMVMADDVAIRNNRLALLHGISAQFLRIADISKLQLS